MDPIGNLPLYINVLKEIDAKRQRKIILRELIIALLIIFVFSFLGEGLMNFLKIQPDTIQIAGGIILFLLCLKMIFPPAHSAKEKIPSSQVEPFIVPLAVPLVAGPGVLAAVMIYTRQEQNSFVMLGAILIAWLATLGILMSASWFQKILGERGILAIERLMGLILTLIAVEMLLSGISTFVRGLHNHTAAIMGL